MIIKSLAVENIRVHNHFNRPLSPAVTVITGDNGSGKTSLIEAIMVALSGKSFKATDRELLRNGAEWWRIDVVLDDQVRGVKFQPEATHKHKQFVIDDKTTIRMPKTAAYPV